MNNIAGAKAYYGQQIRFREDYTSLMTTLRQSISQLYGGSLDDTNIRTTAKNLVLQTFLGSDGITAFAPDGRPLAPYPRVLMKHIIAAQMIALRESRRYMRRRLPPDMVAWLTNAPRPVAEIRAPPRNYAPPLEWRDPRGYVLNARIYRDANYIHFKLDDFLTDALTNRWTPVQFDRRLDQFLRPDLRLQITRPYGTQGGYDGLRLGRTELARAYNEAVNYLGHTNPLADGMDWALSPRHPKPDMCDIIATIGMSGERLKLPYAMESAPVVIQDSHIQCICTNRIATAKDITDVFSELERLRALRSTAPVTPLVQGLIRTLTGLDISPYTLWLWFFSPDGETVQDWQDTYEIGLQE